jgi:pantoate--beta-alanine ligase
VRDAVRAGLERTTFRLQYAEVCDARTLEPARDLKGTRRLLAAAFLGRTRLIDNLAL